MTRLRAAGSAVVLLLAAGCSLPPPAPTGADRSAATQPAVTPSVAAARGPAADVLNRIPVKGRSAKTGYARAAFGQTWADVDHNGCDTRNDVLARDLDDVTYRPGTRNCVVLTGVLEDPYTRTGIVFRRGQSTSSAVQIDHVVALSNAWQTGRHG